MCIDDAVIQLLLTDTTIASIMGERWYPVQAPQGVAMPYGVVEYSSESEHHMRGESGLSHAMVEVTVRSTSKRQAQAIASLARRRIRGLRREVAAGGESLTIYSAQRKDEDLNVESPGSGKGAGVYAAWQLFAVHYEDYLEEG